MHKAVRHYTKECIQILLHHHANIQNINGNTPLHLAAGGNKIIFTKMLLVQATICNIQNKEDKTSKDLIYMSEWDHVPNGHKKVISNKVYSRFLQE